jgi:hypothetical protein
MTRPPIVEQQQRALLGFFETHSSRLGEMDGRKGASFQWKHLGTLGVHRQRDVTALSLICRRNSSPRVVAVEQ